VQQGARSIEMTQQPARMDPAELRQRVADGLSATAIGRELGYGRNTIMRRAKALGIEVHGSRIPKIASIERAVADMGARDAVEFLLELVRQLVPALEEDRVMKVCRQGFTATEAQILLMVFDDRFMPKEVIYDAIYGSRSSGELINPKIIDVMICKIRKKMKEKGWDAVVHTTWGRGYHGERLNGFVFPWEKN